MILQLFLPKEMIIEFVICLCVDESIALIKSSELTEKSGKIIKIKEDKKLFY